MTRNLLSDPIRNQHPVDSVSTISGRRPRNVDAPTNTPASTAGPRVADLLPDEPAEPDAWDWYDPTDAVVPPPRDPDDYTPPVIPGVDLNLPTIEGM